MAGAAVADGAGLKPTWGREFPSHVAPTLTSKALERVWVSASCYNLPPYTGPMVTLITTPAPCAFYPQLFG